MSDDERSGAMIETAAAMAPEALAAVEARVLWLATSIVHHANRVRRSRSGLKVGGHQASSASCVSIMTALFFDHLRSGDLVSVKPHASPVLHAIEYLLGWLDRDCLTTLREFEGLQAYPSRTKDPLPADYSTGSVGIGATATVWRAIAQRYVSSHFDLPARGRQVAVVGDAELDEGAIWEALIDPVVSHLGEILWIVDLNRQSLDRVVPGIAADRLERMFAAAGWRTITLKYGRWLSELFSRPGGEALRRRIDAMSNEEYQRLLRAESSDLRELLSGHGRERREILNVLSYIDDCDVRRALRDLGGHDLALLGAALRQAEGASARPTVILAYTLKAWRLATEGHPGNHSALLSEEQWQKLAADLGADADDPWAHFPAGSPEHRLCATAAARLDRRPISRNDPPLVPTDFGNHVTGFASTQQAFGRFFLELTRQAPEVARRVVTVSPDVASSTNLGGWINKVGVWHLADRRDWFEDDGDSLLHWRESSGGQHIELGIAETNLVGLLGELGATWSRDGQPVLPIGTLYDPFVNRALEPWSFGIYAGGQSVLVGTPSGITLAPEGGAHQSVTTPSVGIAQPQCIAWEPAFIQDMEWALLFALSMLGRLGGCSSYLRLSTRAIDQSLAGTPLGGASRERRRRSALAGGYLLVGCDGPPDVTVVGMGAVMPEAIAAADRLAARGVAADVVCLTSADLVFRALRERSAGNDLHAWILDELLPEHRRSPLVTVLDGHPHALSFLAGVRGDRIWPLGVHDFGQSGDIDDLYRHFRIDSESITAAAMAAVEDTTRVAASRRRV